MIDKDSHGPGYKNCRVCNADSSMITCDMATGRWRVRCTKCGTNTGWLISAQIAFDYWQSWIGIRAGQSAVNHHPN